MVYNDIDLYTLKPERKIQTPFHLCLNLQLYAWICEQMSGCNIIEYNEKPNTTFKDCNFTRWVWHDKIVCQYEYSK